MKIKKQNNDKSTNAALNHVLKYRENELYEFRNNEKMCLCDGLL